MRAPFSGSLWLPALALLLLSAGCPSSTTSEPTDPPLPDDDDDDSADDDDDSGDDDDDDSAAACEPALGIELDSPAVLTHGLVQLRGTGGTGAYRFELIEDQSGALLNELTGAYLAGPTEGSWDTVEMVDLGCEGTASVTLEVVTPMAVAPTQVTLPPRTGFIFDISGGSGSYTCTQTVEGSGAVGPSCDYLAGIDPGVDVVTVEDTATGQVVDVRIEVDPGAALSVTPVIGLPMGSQLSPALSGGSGWFDLDLSPAGIVEVSENGDLSALAPGVASGMLVDRYAGLSAPVEVHVMAAQLFETPLTGDNNVTSLALPAGDVNGDGYPDVLVSLNEADIGASNGGAVYLYAGRAGGMEPNPVRIFAGTTWSEQLGRGVAVGDVTGDGLDDLAIGVVGADFINADRGAVLIYPGVPGAWFADEPALTLIGENGSDNLGSAVAICDFNGDGIQDLAAGARYAEDRDLDTLISGQGAVLVYLGGPGGLPEEPTQRMFGQTPDGAGGWEGQASMYLGWSLAAGDVDGDGLCDLASGTYAWDRPGDSSTGLAVLYRGQPVTADGPGGLTSLPVRAWTTLDEEDSSGQLGRRLALGDLDGDGRDEVVLGHWFGDGVASNGGEVVVFAGEPLTDEPATELTDLSAAAFRAEGENGSDYVGWAVAIADVNGDGQLDLLTGDLQEEVEGGTNNTGTVTVRYGGRPLAELTPSFRLAGEAGGDFFGQAIAVPGDLTGDGLPDLVVLAGRTDVRGPSVSEVYFVGEGEAPLELLNRPDLSAGQSYGRSVQAVGDQNGDGWEDLLVGADQADPAGQVNAGGAWFYAGGPSGFTQVPSQALGGWPNHTGGDQLGYFIGRQGDIDGDGQLDLVVPLRGDDRPSSFSSTDYLNPTECAGSRSNSGVLAFFRGRPGVFPGVEPDTVWYGDEVNNYIDTMTADVDVDGDGYDDVVIGSAVRNSSRGAVWLLRGRPFVEGEGIHVLCEGTDWTWFGANTSDGAGRAVVGVPDLDGDGCDEFAFGSNGEDHGGSNRGSVRLVYGFGPQCADSEPRMVTLEPSVNNAQVGYALASGDIDGDGLADLAVGGINLNVDGATSGGAWVVPGSYLLTLPTEAPAAQPAMVWPLLDPLAEGRFRLNGRDGSEQFGRSVALVPELSGDGRPALLVGSPGGSIGGAVNTGGAQVFRFSTEAGENYGLDPEPIALLGGEPGVDSRLGESVAGGLLRGVPWVAMGGYRADSIATDTGGAYVLQWTSFAP